MAKPRLRLITKKQLHALEDALYNIHRAVIRATYETDDPTIVIGAAADYIKLYISRDRFAMRYGMSELDSLPYDENEENGD
jgi:hypothetical protein